MAEQSTSSQSNQTSGQVANTNTTGSIFGSITNHIFSSTEERAKLTTTDFVIGAASFGILGAFIGARWGYNRAKTGAPLSPFAAHSSAHQVEYV